MAEPITWTVVAIEIGKGALAWVGTKVMEGLFGTRKPNYARLQAESIKQLAVVFQKALEAERLQEATDKLNSLVRNIENYNNAPLTSLFRLHDAANDSLDLLSTLASLGYPGLPSYLVAASVRITILQELHLVAGDQGELLNIILHIRDSIDECENSMAKAFQMFQGMSTSPTAIVDKWVASFNGEGIWGRTRASVLDQQRKLSEAFRKAQLDPNEALYEKVLKEWFGIREVTIERATLAGIEVPRALTVAPNFQSWILHTGTPLHETDNTFQFTFTDWNGDGRPDLVAIKKSKTGTKSTEVHILSGASNFQSWILQTGTPLHETDDTFQFMVTDWNGDGRPDLVAIKKSKTGTKSTEVHILSGASNFQSWILQTGTPLHETDDTFQFMVTDWNGDGRPDLVAIKMSKTGTNSTEVHVLSGASNFQSWILQTGTALHETDEQYQFIIADWKGRGRQDLVVVNKGKPGADSTEVYTLSGFSNYQNYTLKTKTGLHRTDGGFEFAMVNWNGTGNSDLVAIKKRVTGSNSTEVHILAG
ncbi:hypothetical protein BFJ63_vAg18343 [Fusarium oxysporum f. sp. narcissi]|uniref:VCBS repeat-containing protein n=1 Tax=Fusarium oxysporum f. sp. narcissi TaxID=451672 RepID=A0A4Q2V385_FUSOX|nr:hypothetical protein BFJ63_vAg18343 [Fusarium oxysporum f. sp. narcissi]